VNQGDPHIEAKVALEVTAQVAALAGLKIDALRQAWRERGYGPCPSIRAGDLLRRFLAEQIQLEAFGQDPDLRRALDRLAKQHGTGKAAKAAKGASLKPGAVLIREWDGATHRVEVVQDGFVWNGQTYGSLSRIARQITGTNWNGPAFFGLRQKTAA